MKSHRRSPSLRLTKQAVELSFAAPQVIAHRVTRMARAGATPSAADQREFMLMGAEKASAFLQSWVALWAKAFEYQLQLARTWSISPFSLQRLPTRASTRAAVRSYNTLAKFASAGLAPVHKKAVSNAKRLSRRK